MTTFDSTSRYVEAAGARLHYNDVGSGPVLITLHGGGPGANAWDNTKWNVDGLSKTLRLIMLDLPGFGESENVEALDGETQEELTVRVIGAVMDSLGIDLANLYGTSMSGGPVIRFAHDHPDRVGRIILKSPGGMGRNVLTMSPTPGSVALAAFRDDPSNEKAHENIIRLMEQFLPDASVRTEEIVEARYRSFMQASKLAPASKLPVRGAGGDLRSLLADLRMPVLVLWSAQDRVVPVDGALSALAYIPNVRVHLWGGTGGHFIEYEHTAEFNRLVADFLAADWDGRNLI